MWILLRCALLPLTFPNEKPNYYHIYKSTQFFKWCHWYQKSGCFVLCNCSLYDFEFFILLNGKGNVALDRFVQRVGDNNWCCSGCICCCGHCRHGVCFQVLCPVNDQHFTLFLPNCMQLQKMWRSNTYLSQNEPSCHLDIFCCSWQCRSILQWVCHVNYFRGKSNPDVILIGKIDTSLSKKKKRESLGEKAKGTEYFEDSEDSIRRKDKSMYKLIAGFNS